VAKADPPSHVNYDLWLGAAPERPFHPSHFHFNWRFWFDFGGGTLADFGCHYMDLPFWALDLRSPTSVASTGKKTYAGDNDCPDSQQVDYEFPARGEMPPVHFTWYHGGAVPSWISDYYEFDTAGAKQVKRSAVLFEGDLGRLLADYGSRKLYLNDGVEQPNVKPYIPDSIGHHQEWIAACKSRGPTTCNFDYSGALAEAVLLGNVAYRAGQTKFAWDAENLTASDCPAAAAFIRREYRKGWTLEG
jgi:predicted dehydrogenase